MQPVHGTAGNGAQKIRFLLHLRHFDAARGKRLLGLRHQHFRHKQRSRGGHDYGGEQMRSLDTESDVGGHDSAGNVRHAAGHHAHQLRFGQLIQKRPDGQRRFGLSHEDAGGNIERFRAARAHDARHDPRRAPNNELHHANVIEHGKKRGNENDRGQYLKRKGKPEQRSFLPDFSEHEFRANVGKTQQSVYCRSGCLKDSPAKVKSQDKKGEGNLKPQSPKHGFQADGFALCGE